MKQLIQVFFVVLMSTTMFSQNDDATFYFSVSQDVKMSYEGPHGDGGVLNPEIIIGFNINDKNRVWFGYEWLKQIDYQKLTFLAYDHTLNITEHLNMKAGIETSIIYREKINPNDVWYGYKDDWLSVGLNGEFAYKINETIELFLNGNVFFAEPFDNYGNKMKKFRTDVRAGINIKLFKIK